MAGSKQVKGKRLFAKWGEGKRSPRDGESRIVITIINWREEGGTRGTFFARVKTGTKSGNKSAKKFLMWLREKNASPVGKITGYSIVTNHNPRRVTCVPASESVQ